VAFFWVIIMKRTY